MLITVSVIVGVQWVVISYASANRWLVLAALGLPALLGLLHAHSCVDRDHLGQGRSVMMAQDAKHVPLTTAQKLVQDAAEAAEVRAYLTHLDGVALRIQHIRTQVDRMCWGGIVLVLAFTVTNVLGFASAGSPGWSLAWLAAWVLDQPAPAASRALPGGGRPDVEHATWAKVPVSDGRTRIV